MFLEAVGEQILETLVGFATSALRDRLASRSPVADVDTSDAEEAITHHLRMVAQSAAAISFRDLGGSKSLGQSFVDLDLNLGPANAATHARWNQRLKVSDISGLPGHLILLGNPGSGKTTSLKKVAASLFEEAAAGQTRSFPVFVRLRELIPPDPQSPPLDLLTRTLLGILGLAVNFKISCEPSEKRAAERRVLLEFLDRTSATLILDGLDEMHPVVRERVLDELRLYFLHLYRAKILLTCRTADFVYHFENSTVFVLQPLSPDQVAEFAHRWLKGSRPERFLKKLHQNPYAGTAVRPLTLAHLCALFERFDDIPDKPREIYSKIVRLYLEDWDAERSVKRESKYADFGVYRKEQFLQAIAFQLTWRFNATQFSHLRLKDAYRVVHPYFGLPAEEAEQVVKEVESHTGLILEVGNHSFEFSHKSIQEYLTASYILKLPAIPRGIERFPAEAALAVALSSDSTRYVSVLVQLLASSGARDLIAFTEPFLDRLMLEEVDLMLSAELGCSTLWLYSMTYAPEDQSRSGSDAAAPSTFLRFFRLPSVQRSVLELLPKMLVNSVRPHLVLKLTDTIFGFPPSLAITLHRDSEIARELMESPRFPAHWFSDD